MGDEILVAVGVLRYGETHLIQFDSNGTRSYFYFIMYRTVFQSISTQIK